MASVNCLAKVPETPQLIALTLVKLLLFLHLSEEKLVVEDGITSPDDIPGRSAIPESRPELCDPQGLDARIAQLEGQVDTLLAHVKRRNK